MAVSVPQQLLLQKPLRVSPGNNRCGESRVNLNRLVIVSNRAIEISRLGISLATVIENQTCTLKLDRLVIVGNRPVIVALLVISISPALKGIFQRG